MPKDVRVFLFEYILRRAEISPKLIGPGKTFDTACVNWSDEGKGHLIRVFGGKKQKYKTVLTDIPEERPKTNEVVFPDDIEVWKIPDGIFQEFIDHFKKSQKERIEVTKRYHTASENFTGRYLSLSCVQKILEGLPEGQRNKGAHVLAIACRLDGLPKEEAGKVMLTYKGNCSQENISESEYLGWVNWIYAQEEHFWNCRFCTELDVCEKESCTFFSATFQKELEFLKSEDLVDTILKILGKKIKKDEKNKLLVFFVCLSAYGSNPLNLFLKGESSIGKTHLAKTMAEYFPPDDVWFIGDMSPKALIHGHGDFRDGKVYISLREKILIFLESPRKETLEMLRPILSHDRTEIEYKITDKTLSGQLGTKRVIIEGWPATVFCSADFTFLEELSTRSMLTTPEVTEEKIREVLEFKGRQYSRPWLYKEDEQERIFKEALRLVKSDTEVCIPYAEVLAGEYGMDEPRVMRDFDKLMGLIKMSAFLHQKQRIQFDVEDKTFVIANEYDYWVGVSLFDSVRETTLTGIPQPVIDFYEKVISGIEGVINYQSMRETYVKVYGKPLSRTHLRNRFVEPLEDVGWLNHEPDPYDGRRVIFEKCRIEGENPESMEVYEGSYFKGIFGEDQLREYMGELEKIWNYGGKCTEGSGIVVEDCSCSWFYTDRVPYFLEHDRSMNGEIKDETCMKNESSTNLHSLEEKEVTTEVLKKELLDQYDEETVLLQIPEDDTMVEDVVKKFKNQNRVVDTLVVLRDKKKIMVGQGYVRRLGEYSKVKDSAVPRSRLNRWTCGKCGIKFYAQEPYRNYEDHAVYEDCWKKLGS